MSPYFSAAKLAWLIENVEGIKEKVNKNEVCCGNIDSWLIYNLTDEKFSKQIIQMHQERSYLI